MTAPSPIVRLGTDRARRRGRPRRDGRSPSGSHVGARVDPRGGVDAGYVVRGRRRDDVARADAPRPTWRGHEPSGLRRGSARRRPADRRARPVRRPRLDAPRIDETTTRSSSCRAFSGDTIRRTTRARSASTAAHRDLAPRASASELRGRKLDAERVYPTSSESYHGARRRAREYRTLRLLRGRGPRARRIRRALRRRTGCIP